MTHGPFEMCLRTVSFHRFSARSRTRTPKRSVCCLARRLFFLETCALLAERCWHESQTGGEVVSDVGLQDIAAGIFAGLAVSGFLISYGFMQIARAIRD